MNRRGLVAAIVGVPVALVLVAASTSGKTPLFERYPDISFESAPLETPSGSFFDLEPGEEETDVFKIWEVDLPDVLDVILQILLAAAAVAIVVSLWNRRPRLRWRLGRPADDFDVLDDLAAMVQADAEAQRQVLAGGTPRNAIVACWLRLESLTVDAGFERDPSDTSEEFTSRVLGQFAVDAGAVGRLAGLFRKARFSSHEMGEGERSEAIEALDAIHRGLQRATPVAS